MVGHPRARLAAARERLRAEALARRLRTARLPPLGHRGREGGMPETIVSLTSFGTRVSNVDLAIRSILANTTPPDRVILWLDGGTARELPERLEELEGCGVEIRRGVEDLRGHKKYLFAMRENPRATIITIDDDAMYPPDTVASLLSAAAAHPGCVAARRVHWMRWDAGRLLPYAEWAWERRDSEGPSMALFPTGVGGVLYPAGSLGACALDEGGIRECALAADDVWLKVNEVLAGTPVVWAPCEQVHPCTIPGTQREALNASNVSQGRNDAALRGTLRHFGVDEAAFVRMLAAGGATEG